METEQNTDLKRMFGYHNTSNPSLRHAWKVTGKKKCGEQIPQQKQ